jgi:LmbE family N-acetylglucosaminyl deacetylase
LPEAPLSRRRSGRGALVGYLLAVGAAGVSAQNPATAPATGVQCVDPKLAPALSQPPAPLCANDLLSAYDRLLVLAPHPDDETLAFGGLLSAFHAAGKPVEVVVVTDGDAYCEACRLWKTGSTRGPVCNAAELSNFATPAVDSLGEVRREESRAAARILGLPAPTFLGYPDTGLRVGRKAFLAGDLDTPLRRSDFTMCKDCETCEDGWGGGPATELTTATLVRALRERLLATSGTTLIGTTHWLDRHGDHSGLGEFVRAFNAGLPQPRAVAYAVVHAHTLKDTEHPDCWYPAPPALVCPCAEQACAEADATWVCELARHRFRPSWPAALPDDADYGVERQLCGIDVQRKNRAIRAYASQLGTAARNGEIQDALAGILDCNGYLGAFARTTEAFVLETPESE